MFRRSLLSRGVTSAVREEMSKAAALLAFYGSNTWDRLRGVDGLSSEEVERQQKLRDAMQEKAKEQTAKAAAPASVSTWQALKEQATAAFSPKAGMAAVVNHCTQAHAAAVAIEQGIDVKSVNVVVEKAAVGEGTKVVGYIEAPAASEEEVFVYAEKLQKACPAARMHGGIEWRQRR